MKSPSKASLTTLALTVALTGLTFRAAAGDDKSTTDPTGAWKVTMISTNAQARPMPQTLKLKLTDGKLTGTLTYNSGPVVNGKAPKSELPITDAKLEGNQISFKFTHPPAAGKGPNGDYTYEGKISGDTIKGTCTTEWMGNSHTRDWQAERLKD